VVRGGVIRLGPQETPTWTGKWTQNKNEKGNGRELSFHKAVRRVQKCVVKKDQSKEFSVETKRGHGLTGGTRRKYISPPGTSGIRKTLRAVIGGGRKN